MTKEKVQEIYKEYVSQSSAEFSNDNQLHENEHDNSGSHPDYHNDSHDNTPSSYSAISQCENVKYQNKNVRLQLLKLYLSQSSTVLLDEMEIHENEHDNSRGHPNYHNDSHDNTPEISRLVLTKHATN